MWLFLRKGFDMNPLKQIQKAIDRLFLRRLERVLNENVLNAEILFKGKIGGEYDYIREDPIRGYSIEAGFSLHHNSHRRETLTREEKLNHDQELKS